MMMGGMSWMEDETEENKEDEEGVRGTWNTGNIDKDIREWG